MIYTGEPIDAQRALDVGLVHRVVPRARLADDTRKLAISLAAMPEATVRAAKQAARRGDGPSLAQMLRLERTAAGGA
jgi:enoyl-CoA hydratase